VSSAVAASVGNATATRYRRRARARARACVRTHTPQRTARETTWRLIKKERSVAPFTRRRAVQIGAAGSFVAAATSAARRFALASKMERVSSFEKSLNESHTQSCKVNFEAGSKEHTAWARKEKYALYLPKRTSGEMGETKTETQRVRW